MNIVFNNLSNEYVELTIDSETLIIPAYSSKEHFTYTNDVSFSVNPYEKSSLSYFIKRVGLVRKKNFCTRSNYKATVNTNAVINIVCNCAKGKFSDTYRRAVATSENLQLILESYSIADEKEMRDEFARAKKKGKRTILIFDILDILKSGLIVFLILLIPFALIWIFGSLETAYTVCRNLFIPIFIVIIIFNRIFDRLKKKLWYYIKGKSLKNYTYKGTDSHFTDEYIREIF